MPVQHDPYELLGVARDADAKQIKRAFLKKARELHPDVSDAPDAEERFKEVNEAYSILSDEQKRANYDRFGDPDGPSGFGGGAGVDISDIFGGFGMSDLFSSFFNGGGMGRGVRTRGHDMGITLTISLEEAAAGVTKTISYGRLAPCDDCAGSGAAEGGHPTSCATCHGTGRVVSVQRTILGQMQTQSSCPDCGGSGTVIDQPCETCDGQGRTPSQERLEIKLPAGVRAGQQLVMHGMGEAGIRGDIAGDLIVTVNIEPHEHFVRSGDDLGFELHLDSIDAMLGTTQVVDGILDGEKVTIEVPAGSQYGQRITVPAAGMPHVSRDGRGDLIAVLCIDTPQELSDKERALLTELAQLRRTHTSQDSAEPNNTSRNRAEGSDE